MSFKVGSEMSNVHARPSALAHPTAQAGCGLTNCSSACLRDAMLTTVRITD